MSSLIHQPHDKLFRASMGDARVAHDFFLAHLPKKLLKKINLKTLALQKTTFINQDYHASEADLVFAVKHKQQPAYLYLLCEHQSKVDRLMAFRLLSYVIRIIEQHLQKKPGSRLPLVYPMVVYSGQAVWHAPLDVFQLFTDEETAREILLQPFCLIDVARLDDNELQKHRWSGLVEFALKYRHLRDLATFCDAILPRIKQISQRNGEDFCHLVLDYVIDGLTADDEQLFLQKINQHLADKLRGGTMTLAERFEQRGRKQGIEQGIEQEKIVVAQRLLAEGVELAFIAKITELPLAQIKKLKKSSSPTCR